MIDSIGRFQLNVESRETGRPSGFSTIQGNGENKTYLNYSTFYHVEVKSLAGNILHSYDNVSNYYYNADGWLVVVQQPDSRVLVRTDILGGTRLEHDATSKVVVLNLNKSEEKQFENSTVGISLTDGSSTITDFDSIIVSHDEDRQPRELQFEKSNVFPIPDAYVPKALNEKVVTTVFTLRSPFTPKDDVLDFNKVTASQVQSWTQYHNAFEGNDTVKLPNYNISFDVALDQDIQLPFAGNLLWNRAIEFKAGGGDDTIYGGAQVDKVDLGAGKDTWIGSFGNDIVKGGSGADIFDFRGLKSAVGPAQSFITLDGGRTESGADERDELLLPGSSGDYIIVPNVFTDVKGGTYAQQASLVFTSASWRGQEAAPTDVTYDVTNLEKVRFETGPTNVVKLQTGNVVTEMAMLAKEVYGKLPTLGHQAEPLYLEKNASDFIYTGPPSEQPGGLAAPNGGAIVNYTALESNYITQNAIGRGWHPVSALELGLPSVHFSNVEDSTAELSWGGSNSIEFSMFAGHYQARNPPAPVPFAGNDQPEANALVLTGVVNGVKTLAIVFRGTDQIADFADYPNFAQHYAKFEPLLSKLKIYMAENGITQILAGGHSLGGGMVEYFAADPRFATDNVYGFTWGSPGSDVSMSPSAAGRLTNFVHDEDPVAAVVKLFNNDLNQRKVLEQVANVAIGQTAPNSDVSKSSFVNELNKELIKGGVLTPAVATLLEVVNTKVRHGATVTINTPKSHELQQLDNMLNLEMQEHSMLLYGQDMIHLTSEQLALVSASATDPFAFQNSVLASYLRNPLGLRLSADVQVAIAEPRGNSYNSAYGKEIWVDGNDTFVLGNKGSNAIIITDLQLNSFKSTDGAKIFRVIDGSGSNDIQDVVINGHTYSINVSTRLKDTLVLPGTADDYYLVQNERGFILYKLMPHGVPDVNIAKLISIESFTFTGANKVETYAKTGQSLTFKQMLERGVPDQSHYVGGEDWGGPSDPEGGSSSSQARLDTDATAASATSGATALDPYGVLTTLGAGTATFASNPNGNKYALDGGRGISSTIHFTEPAAGGASGAKDVLDLNRFHGNDAELDVADGLITLTVAGLTKSFAGVERVAFADGILGLDVNGTSGLAYRIYQAAFAREPDTAGLTFWFNQLDKGLSANAVANAYLGSAEFQALYGANPTNNDYITLLYKNVLGRAPDQAGLDFWNGQMASGTSRESMLIEFSESAENKDVTRVATESGIWFDLVI